MKFNVFSKFSIQRDIWINYVSFLKKTCWFQLGKTFCQTLKFKVFDIHREFKWVGCSFFNKFNWQYKRQKSNERFQQKFRWMNASIKNFAVIKDKEEFSKTVTSANGDHSMKSVERWVLCFIIAKIEKQGVHWAF